MSTPSPPSLWQRFLSYSSPNLDVPLPASAIDRFLFGVAQPILALRLLLSEQGFLIDALKPALLLAGFCALAALLHLEIGGTESVQHLGFLRRFYATFAVLAPLPSIVLSTHYARLAAKAYRRFQFGDCAHLRSSLWQAAIHALKQALVIAIAVAPLLGLVKHVPWLGTGLAAMVGALWALHWVVVEAFDSARVAPVSVEANPPSDNRFENVEGRNPQAATAPEPPEVWFVRPMFRLADRLPIGKRMVRWFASFCRYLSRPWQEEIALTEAHPVLVFGFALTTAALLATPVLNLLFRPIIVTAAVALLGQLARSRAPADAAQR